MNDQINFSDQPIHCGGEANHQPAAPIGIEDTIPVVPRPSSERFHSLDALRAFALLLGVVFHSVLPYVLPPGIWAIGVAEPVAPLQWFAFYSHSFRMEVFFLLAGFFARLVTEKRGAASFLRDRAVRILLVLVVALYPMKLLLAGVWISGGLKTGWLQLPPEVAQLPIWQLAIGSLEREQWPDIKLTHLWFLYYLACISGLFMAVRWLAIKMSLHTTGLSGALDTGFLRAGSSWLAPLGLALIVTPILTGMTGPNVDTPDKSLAWEWPVLWLYTLFFCLGWWLHRRSGLLDVLGRRWKLYLPLSLAVSVLAGMGIGLHMADPMAAGIRWAASFGTSLTMSLAVLGWLGLFARIFHRPSTWIRYLADSSYWIYLAHLPLVVALQVWLSSWPASWWLKLPLVNALAFAILLASYHGGVRFTWIGAWLNGRRAKKA